jgi:hypothetical protein
MTPLSDKLVSGGFCPSAIPDKIADAKRAVIAIAIRVLRKRTVTCTRPGRVPGMLGLLLGATFSAAS